MRQQNIDKIAIIGAGPGGLAAAKYLIAEKKFSTVDVFEQRSTPGGVWNYTANTTLDFDFAVPRTRPSKDVEAPVFEAGNPAPVFVSPLYDALETNIPHTLMNYSDKPFPEGSSLFPKRQLVIEYLKQYAKELDSYIHLNTQIVDVAPVTSNGAERWSVTTRDLLSKQETTSIYDAVICGNGHYSDPFIPSIKGLDEFDKTYPSIISHSKYYRRPDEYNDKRVIIVGHSASGLDLSNQISQVSKVPVLVSEKTVPEPSGTENANAKKEHVPEIVEFLVAERGVRFADGRVETSIDSIIFCTGYQYSFPFLRSLDPPVVTTGQRTENVYEHIFYHPRPTLVFIGLPQRIVPLPVSEAQAGYVARVFSGRLELPSAESMRDWESSLANLVGESKSFHTLGFPKDADYINRLYEHSMSADANKELENEGKGKIPPYWDEEKRWARERFPLIKAASRKLGAARHEVRTLEELGFDYQKWKAEQEADVIVDSPTVKVTEQQDSKDASLPDKAVPVTITEVIENRLF